MTSAARTVLRTTVQLDRRGLHGTDGLRTALGVGVPLLIGLAVDRPLDGLAAAGGAFSAGYAVFATGYRARLSALLLATVAVSVSTFVGSVVGDTLWLLALTVALWGWAAGMLVSLGVAQGIVGLQSVISLLVITQYSMPLQDGLGRAGLVLLGGLVQVALLLTVWPLRRSPAERSALAEVYRSLAAYAAGLPDGHAGPPDGRPLEAARLALRDPQPFLRDEHVLLFSGLHDEAERLRATLSGLALLRAQGGASVHLDALARATAAVLDDVAAAVELPRSGARAAAVARLGPEGSPHRWADLVAASGRMDGAASGLGGEVARLATALLGSLVQIVRVPAPRSPRSPQARARSSAWREALPTLRAHLTLRSAVLRHALRLAATLGAGTLLAGGLPFEHRYWLPLTALVVLKPDFRSTFARGIGRIVGTAAGAALASGVAAALRPGPLVLALLVVLTAWGCYAFLFANYALFGLCVTAFVVFLLSFAGLPETSTVVQRIEATVLGGALALLAYAVWPTWERVRVPEQLARLLLAQGDYAARLLEGCARPLEEREASELEERRAAALMARNNAEASVERARGEPAGRSGGLAVADAASVVAAVRGFALAALALQALPLAGRGAAREPLLAFARELRTALDELAASLREGRPPRPRPALETAHEQLRTALAREARTGADVARDAAVLEVESVALLRSAQTVRAVLAASAGPARDG